MPIPGTKRRTYLEQNVAVADLSLTADQLARIGQAVPKEAIAGQRYTDMTTVNR